MPYICRDAQGQIESLHKNTPAASPAAEFLPDDHPAVQAFVGAGGDGFVRLDAGFVRVIEDLIDVLMVKNVITITDLPAEAQTKLMARKSFRDRSGHHALRLFGDTEAEASLLEPDYGKLM